MTKEILKLLKTNSGYQIQIDNKTTGLLCPDEALGFIAHLLFKSSEKENLYPLHDQPAPKDKALQEYAGLLFLQQKVTTYQAMQEINSRLKALEAANEKA